MKPTTYPSSDKQLSYETADAVYWYSHRFDPFNNWSARAVKIWGKKFPTAEHAYQYRKYADVDPKIAQKIFDAPSAWAAAKIGRSQKPHRERDWERVKVDIMTEIVRAKVAQNDDVRELLVATGTKRVIENSPVDAFFGGLAKMAPAKT